MKRFLFFTEYRINFLSLLTVVEMVCSLGGLFRECAGSWRVLGFYREEKIREITRLKARWKDLWGRWSTKKGRFKGRD